MRAGDLDRLITIEQPTESKDEYGAPTVIWTSFAQVWAGVRYDNGTEYFAAGQMNARIDAVFRIRHRAGITTKMRVAYDGEYFDILEKRPLGRDEGFDLKTIARQA